MATQSTSPTNSHHVSIWPQSQQEALGSGHWMGGYTRPMAVAALSTGLVVQLSCLALTFPLVRDSLACWLPSSTWPGSYVLTSPTSKLWLQWFSTSACSYIFRATNFVALRLKEAAGWLTSTLSSPPLEPSDQFTSGIHTYWPVLPLTHIFI